jgi:hypothetical protein
MSTFMDPSNEMLTSSDLVIAENPAELEIGSGSGSGSGSETELDDSDFYDYDIDESFASFDWAELGPSLSVYSITFLFGIVGNILILVIIRLG